MYQDETLKCRDCGNEFVFTAGEQEFYASRGFENKPSRCKECRAAKKNAQKGAREMFDAVCVECGKECQVPFKPTEGKAVYCSECFAAKREQYFSLALRSRYIKSKPNQSKKTSRS